MVVPKLLTPRQVAKATGLQLFRVYELIREHGLPTIRVGRTYRVSEHALAAWIEEQQEQRGGVT
jgi:excisionase family DNA binding protein